MEMQSHVPLESQTQLSWFAGKTWPRDKKGVRQHLEYSGNHCFLALYAKLKRWNNGCKALVEFPLFLSYNFVEMGKRECGRILVDPGVARVNGTGREPATMPGSEIQALRHATLFGKL